MFWSKKTAPQPPAQRDPASFFTTHAFDAGSAVKVPDILRALIAKMPKAVTAGALDDSSNGAALKMAYAAQNIPEVLAMWYASQTFIGHQMCAILAQHGLIDKACSMPGRDAMRQGFDVVSVSGDDLDDGVRAVLQKYDRSMRLRWNLEQFIRMGRIFGIRVAMFKVDSTDRSEERRVGKECRSRWS